MFIICECGNKKFEKEVNGAYIKLLEKHVLDGKVTSYGGVYMDGPEGVINQKVYLNLKVLKEHEKDYINISEIDTLPEVDECMPWLYN